MPYKNVADHTEFVKRKYDRMNLQMPKGRKAIIDEVAKENGMTTTSFILQAITEKLERMGKEN